MFSNQLLYIKMSRRELQLGYIWFVLFVIASILHPIRSTAWTEFFFHFANFAAAILIFRKFLVHSCQVPLTGFGAVCAMAALGAFLAWLANLLTNDLIYFYLPKWFFYDDFGPHFYNVLKQDILTTHLGENPTLTFFAVAVFAPFAEELFHRGLVFGSLCRKSLALAYTVSVLLYAFLPLASLFGKLPVEYIVISFLQYIPMGVMFNWIYTRTETIWTPILAHILLNSASILAMR